MSGITIWVLILTTTYIKSLKFSMACCHLDHTRLNVSGCDYKNSNSYSITGACCCGQVWVRHMICGQTCDELYHFTLHSEIDQIHLSIEAQCGTACLPMDDCHKEHPPEPLLGHWVPLMENLRYAAPFLLVPDERLTYNFHPWIVHFEFSGFDGQQQQGYGDQGGGYLNSPGFGSPQQSQEKSVSCIYNLCSLFLPR